jgi:two-component system phosphate regulon response regulator PhoB
MLDRSPRIMVVDDLVDHRELLSQVLVDLGYAVDTVGDAHTALDAIRRGPRPQLVLVDFWMPGMGGHEFLAVLRAESDPALARIPVVVMTADPDGVAELLAPTPPDLLLEKPFGLRELRRVVVRYCGQGAASHRWGASATHHPE